MLLNWLELRSSWDERLPDSTYAIAFPHFPDFETEAKKLSLPPHLLDGLRALVRTSPLPPSVSLVMRQLFMPSSRLRFMVLWVTPKQVSLKTSFWKGLSKGHTPEVEHQWPEACRGFRGKMTSPLQSFIKSVGHSHGWPEPGREVIFTQTSNIQWKGGLGNTCLYFILFIYLFGCVGSSLLRAGFL